MRVIAKSSLKKFWGRPGCGDARGPLHSWYDEAVKATWRSPQDVKDQYASASICGNNRVVFNVGGNKYRLVVEMQYRAGIVWVNTYRAVSPVAAFGGVKGSGYGRESGFQAMWDYTRPKTIWVNTSSEPVANPFVMR